jgi:hypothetical protein
MESKASTTAPPHGPQLLCESTNTTPELCELARQVALHLEASSLTMLWEDGETKRAEVFRLKWMPEFNHLVQEVLKIAVCCIRISCYLLISL